LCHNGQDNIYSHIKTSVARWSTFFGFSCPILHRFSQILISDQFGALLVRLVRRPSFSNFMLACPLCPPGSSAPAPGLRHTRATPKIDPFKITPLGLYYIRM
jgi:hypothetical protein